MFTGRAEPFAWAEKPEEIRDTDAVMQAGIVIIGAGHAGTCAARAAAERGASVIVIEQQDRKKQWVLGVGEIGHINSRWQRKRGIAPVDIDEFVQDWQTRTGNRSSYRLIRRYAQNCGACFDWLLEGTLTEEEQEGIHAMMHPASPNYPRTLNGFHSYPGTPRMGMELMTKAVKKSQEIAEKNGARFLFAARALQLVREGDRVTGVIARGRDGTLVRIDASKGVVLAAGDYSRNEAMCRDLLAESADLIDAGDWSGHGWDGSGILMGLWAGGRLEPRPHAGQGGNYSFPGFDLIGSAATLRVNCHGKRYSDEGFGTHVLAALPGARQPNGMLWGIFDDNIEDQLTFQQINHGAFDYSDPRELEKLRRHLAAARENMGRRYDYRDKAGDVRPLYCAMTLEELAACLFEKEEERETFLSETARYNELCSRGKDEDFGKDPHLLYPIRKAPFYACGNRKDSEKPFGQSLKLLVTVSGLMIDENQQVLGRDFEPIPGLYASGNCSGGRFGFQYTTSVPGQSISMAQTLGRELGYYLADLEEKQ